MCSSVLLALLATLTVHAPRHDLVLEVARTDAQRERGLMDRNVLAPHTGMLFVFAADATVAFWMKNTLIPLDMVFVAGDGAVRKVFADVPAVPSSLSDDRIPRETAAARYVIELPAGEAAADGIAPGVRLDLRDVPPPQ